MQMIRGTSVISLVLSVTTALAPAGDVQAKEDPGPATRTPIQHVIVVIAENRSYDHVFGTYDPKAHQSAANLLSRAIVNRDGTPGAHFGAGAQFTVPPQASFYIGAPSKAPYAILPPPDTLGAHTAPSDTAPPPFATLAAASAEPDLEPANLVLLTTGATGLPLRSVDTRVANATSLPNGPFQLTGPTMPYDAYTGDTIHRFYQMWQQSDCSVSNATPANPSGCLSDLYPFVNISFATRDNGVGNPMAFFNVNDGDAPLLKRLADEFASSDNFHQSVMGGTAANHVMLGMGDAVFFSDGNGNAITPPASVLANPNPRPGTNNVYTVDGNWSDCSDSSHPGVGPIVSYLGSLPYQPRPNCAPGHFYMLNNVNPAFLPDGQLRTTGIFVPPSSVRTIGDALNDMKISWRYYGGGFDAAVAGQPNAYCQICNPFQYAKAIMGNAAQRAEHIKDTADLLGDIRQGTLPAVAFAKPDGLLDGHPQSSKLGLFEAYLKNILDTLDGNPMLKAHTAVFVIFDETGGYYDSGFIQPLDFFGDGPRVPLIVVSPFSRGGRVSHTYTDHVSILKFIERNWGLRPLSDRSRDNLPNPIARRDNPYVPVNMPAIGDLFDMFHFGEEQQPEDRQEEH
jgi:phospholipase C